MFTFYLSQVGVSTFTTSKVVLDERCACVHLLLGSPGADLGSEEARTGGQGSQGQKPSLHPGAFSFLLEMVFPLEGGQRGEGRGQNKT